MKILGVVLIVYAVIVVVIAVIKPESIWKMKKIELFKKVLGDTGTEIFFYIWALLSLALGIWLLTK